MNDKKLDHKKAKRGNVYSERRIYLLVVSKAFPLQVTQLCLTVLFVFHSKTLLNQEGHE